MNGYLVENLIWVFVGVFFAAFIVLFHPGAVFVMWYADFVVQTEKSLQDHNFPHYASNLRYFMSAVTCIIPDMTGFLRWFGLKMNGVCVVNLVDNHLFLRSIFCRL